MNDVLDPPSSSPPTHPPTHPPTTSTAHAPDAYTELVPWAADRLDDLYSKTTLCLRCDAAVIAQIAVYLAVRYYNLPEPKVEDAAGGGGGGGEKKATTWRELFGLGDDAQTFCLIKRAIDVYRGNQFAGYDYRPLVRTIDLEIAAALANEKREDLPRGSQLTASPPHPPPPPHAHLKAEGEKCEPPHKTVE
jgi:hypothetical protein